MQNKFKRPYNRKPSSVKNIRMSDELLLQIECLAQKGTVSAWIKDACRHKLLSMGITPRG